MQDDDKPPASHDDLNQPGMTNGVPDDMHKADSKAVPNDDRGASERAAGQSGGRQSGENQSGENQSGGKP